MEFPCLFYCPFPSNYYSGEHHNFHPAHKMNVRMHKMCNKFVPSCASASICSSGNETSEAWFPSLLKPNLGSIFPYFKPPQSLHSSHQVKAHFKWDPFKASPAIAYFLCCDLGNPHFTLVGRHGWASGASCQLQAGTTAPIPLGLREQVHHGLSLAGTVQYREKQGEGTRSWESLLVNVIFASLSTHLVF